MKRLASRLLATSLAALMLLGLTACQKEVQPPYVSRLPQELEPYALAWQLDAPELAERRGEIHYYFMAGEGMVINAASDYPEKWGDATLVVFPNGETMLIDAAMGAYAPVLVENLRRLGVEKLDYLFISHPHDDHSYGALVEGGVLDSFEVGMAYHSGLVNAAWSKYSLPEIFAGRGIPAQELKAGDVLTIGGVELKVFSPEDCTGGVTAKGSTNINNLSLVVRFTYGEHTALFTGDIYVERERELVLQYGRELDVDLLKMPHHGTEVSNSRDFAKVTSPEIAVAMGRRMVQKENYYYYAAEGARVLMDEHDGYIHISSDGKTMTYETSRQRLIDTPLKQQYAALDKWAGLE